MIVGTTETAKILNISSARLRVLLMAGRVEGAYKTGRMWLIPLFDGKPIIKKGKRGPVPRWRNPRKPAKTIVHYSRVPLLRKPQQGRSSTLTSLSTIKKTLTKSP